MKVTTKSLSKILIANRGEIAVRIHQTAKAMGYRTVAVYSEADLNARHVRLADEAVCLGPANVQESYLSIPKIMEAAKRVGADAIHPGYGFLSENEHFSQACVEAGITFIGPPTEAIALMGNKAVAKDRMLEAGIPCIPGYLGKTEEDQRDDRLLSEAKKIGFPLMIKASAGGGGRGMRLVYEDSNTLLESIQSARSEASGAFGSGELILEKAIMNPRHIEIQVFADQYGNTLYLGERDCSIQRRHQKVVEEAPSPAVDPTLRKKMGEVAVAVCKSVNYVGAGTVEFLLDDQGDFYFLEMNTRLQVEHCVTEMITGLDLVSMQIKVASGKALELTQKEIQLKGHSIEVRLYAEDPAKGFLPQSGELLYWKTPQGEGIRVDHGLNSSQEISSHYDPMLAKIIAVGEDREEARRRLHSAVVDCLFFGVKSNLSFLGDVLDHPTFAEGKATTAFLQEHFSEGEPTGISENQKNAKKQDTELGFSLAAILLHHSNAAQSPGITKLQHWNNSTTFPHTYHLECDGTEQKVLCASPQSMSFLTQVAEEKTEIRLLEIGEIWLRFVIDGIQQKAAYWIDEAKNVYIHHAGKRLFFESLIWDPSSQGGGKSKTDLSAVMDGRIVTVQAQVGDKVQIGQTLVILEAMKMEHPIQAQVAGTVAEIHVQEGQQVKTRQLLVEVKPFSED